MKTAVVTDSTCDLAADFVRRHNIHILPLKILYPDREYHDGVDIQPEEIYQRMPGEIPKTSTPSPGEVKSLWEKLSVQGFTKVLAIHISSGLSSTINTVRMVSQEFPHIETAVIDSKALSMALGFLVMEAARLVKDNVPFLEVVSRLQNLQQKIHAFFVVGTLEYLKIGGRINTVAATIGEVLKLKPIISINEDGKYYTFAKVRGRHQSLQRLAEIVEESLGVGKWKLAVMHGGAPEEANRILERLSHLRGVVERFYGQIGPAMVVHTGPGLVGVAFCPAE